MRYKDLLENDHAQALQDTGFWGRAAAGCIIISKSSKRILLCHRSEYVEQPGTYGTWGGAIDSGENPEKAAKREVYEETGYQGHVELVPLYVFKSGTFSYYNFAAVVDREFVPELDWESQGYVWCNYGEWPSPLHFGLVSLLNDQKSIETIKTLVDHTEE